MYVDMYDCIHVCVYVCAYAYEIICLSRALVCVYCTELFVLHCLYSVVLQCVVLYCIVLYMYMYISLKSVHKSAHIHLFLSFFLRVWCGVVGVHSCPKG